MTAYHPSHPHRIPAAAVDAAETELQQELRAMFEVDTQQHLQTYLTLVQQLNAATWAADIQHIYRAIHTIKGSAVTVEADAIFHAAVVLEDLLSDLRYLEEAPPLNDGQMGRMLLEAGELLGSSLEINLSGEAAKAQVQPTVERIRTLHENIKQRFLPDWSEMTQVYQEFAEQGFELVVLELEMALGQLPTTGAVPPALRQIGRQTLEQLQDIGQDLKFAADWGDLMRACEQLVQAGSADQWSDQWPRYFKVLKGTARKGGELDEALRNQLPEWHDPNLTQASETETAAETAIADVIHPGDRPDDRVEAYPEPSEVAALAASEIDSASIPAFGDIENPDFSDFDLAALDLDLSALIEPDLHGTLDLESDLLALGIPDAAHAVENQPPLNATELTTVFEGLAAEELAADAVTAPDAASEPPAIAAASAPLITPPETADPEATAAIEFDGSSLDEFLSAEALSIDISEFSNFDVDIDEDFAVEGTGQQPESEGIAQLDMPAASAATSPVEAAGLFPTPVAVTPAKTSTQTPAPRETAPEKSAEPARGVQIPVPLERLDQSSQQVIETLLTARSASSLSKELQFQMVQLTGLTQESAQSISRLRQLQDDYALLRNISDEQVSESGVTLERYRQGYTTINRLLENILRMSEMGREIETVMQQTVNTLGQLDRDILRLKDGIETSRLVPFRNLSLRARAILRDLTNRYGKPAQLVVEGDQVELDAGVVQQLEPALLHLLRNAYDHGLESPEERLTAGKSVQGTIRLSIQRRGNLYRLTLADDGRGVDAQTIQQAAQAKGCALTQTQTPADLLAVLCQPGFSSREAVSDVSGRGVGMDVVANQVAAIGGHLMLSTALGQGTTFTLEVPAPQMLVPCVLLQVGERLVALPTEDIVETVLMSSVEAEAIQSSETLCTWRIKTGRSAAAGFDLMAYWQTPQRAFPDTAICIRTRHALEGQSGVWFMADDLLGREELLINPLPSPLVTPVGMLGVSLQTDGRLISVLDPSTLTEAIQKPQSTQHLPLPSEAQSGTAATASSAMRILVVDDAALMRRRLEGSLGTYGFETMACGDGLEAWNWLQANSLPDLIITDVEMPNMDGFTLIDRCRQAGMTLPILVVSSRLSEEWGKEARRLGADDYLNKGFSTTELIHKVNEMLTLDAVPV